MNEAQIASGRFIISSCQSSGILELIETSLDLVAQSIDERIEERLFFAIRSSWNDRNAPLILDVLPDGIGVIALVSNEDLRIFQILIL